MDENEYLKLINKWKEENKELIASGKCVKLFSEILPKKFGVGSQINKIVTDWKNTIGFKVYFIYEDIDGMIEIISYNSKKRTITVRHKEKNFEMNYANLLNAHLGNILGKYTSNFKFEIRQTFKDNKRDFTIIDRKTKKIKRKDGRFENKKYYRYICNKCNFECDEHWDIKERQYKEECWIEESRLLRGDNCVCCSNKIVAESINSIVANEETQWMISYFQGGYDEAKKYLPQSNQKIYPICPDCGRVKDKAVAIYGILKNHSIGCACSDKTPYPEKFFNLVLQQLDINYKTQLSKTTFKWCDKYRYDFYFEYKGEKYITETHGKQHYEGNTNFRTSLEEVRENDRNKKRLALENGIKEENYIVIDCRKSTLEWIRDNENGILNSKLNELFDLSKIDWEYINKNVHTNEHIKICYYKKEHPNTLIGDIEKELGYGRNLIYKSLLIGDELGICNYDPVKEKSLSSSINGKRCGKKLVCLENGLIFNSTGDCERRSEEFFGVKLSRSTVSQVCTGKRKTHKGFRFKYIEDLTQEEYIKYDVANKLKELEKAS